VEAKNSTSAYMLRIYQITMTTKVDHDSVDEKNYFLNTQDMDLRLICMSISPELQYHVKDESISTMNELWTILEVLFKNKEDCEDCMQKIDKKYLAEKPLEDQASQFEDTSAQVSTQFFFHSFEMVFTPFQICFLNHMKNISSCISRAACRHFYMHHVCILRIACKHFCVHHA
jgi:hypothetical protein